MFHSEPTTTDPNATESQRGPFVSEIGLRRYAFSVEKPVFRRILRALSRDAVPTKILARDALFDK